LSTITLIFLSLIFYIYMLSCCKQNMWP